MNEIEKILNKIYIPLLSSKQETEKNKSQTKELLQHLRIKDLENFDEYIKLIFKESEMEDKILTVKGLYNLLNKGYKTEINNFIKTNLALEYTSYVG